MKTSKPRVPRIRGFVLVGATLAIVAALSVACEAPPIRARHVSPDRVAALRAEMLPAPFDRLAAAAPPLPAGGLGTWLDLQYEEGQSIAEFRASHPRAPTQERIKIVIVRMGTLSAEENEAFDVTKAFLFASFGLPVVQGADRSVLDAPERAWRRRGEYGPQLLTTYALDSLLAPRMPDDAFAYVGVCAVDLFPEGDEKFVNGATDAYTGTGLWSLSRFRDPSMARTDRRPLLGRAVKMAMHEVGHLVGMKHCIAHRCLMNDFNTPAENDARPYEFCPVCMAKVCEALGLDPIERARRVEAELRKLDLNAAAAHERRVRGLLEGNPRI